jgi:hypothetical protein
VWADDARVTAPGGRLALFHPVGRAVLAARHGRRLTPADVRAEPNLRPLLRDAGWTLTAYHDTDERYRALAVRHVDQAARIALGLIEDGHAERLLISTGLSRVAQTRKYGGYEYAYLFHALLPRLREPGVDEDAIRLLTHDKPLRWLPAGPA